jgi:hypothetical protein
VPAAAAAQHAKFGEAMGQLAIAAKATAEAANKVRVDLDKWRRSSVEKWVRSHGASLVAYYTYVVATRQATLETGQMVHLGTASD